MARVTQALDRETHAGFFGVDDAIEGLQTVDPLVLSLGVLAALALLAGAWWVVRWLRRPPGVRLQRVLEKHDEVSVLMHPNPDPDAMACAMGVEKIAETVDTEATIQHAGEIRHQENRAFRNVLDLEEDLESIETASELVADAVVLVDHNSPRGFTDSKTVEPIAVVDHHPGNGTGSSFTDVRTDYGAASTILTEYLQEIGGVLEVDAEDEAVHISSTLATGLVYGIHSDTNHLTRGCSRADFEANAFLFDGIDTERLDDIATPRVSEDVLKVKARAIEQKRIQGSFAVCDVGEIPNKDVIPQAADELLLLEGVSAVVVFGENDGTIHLSGRSRDARVHMGETLRHAVEDIPMANAGGHRRMAGGELSVDHMNGIGPSDGIAMEEFETRLFDAMAGER